MKFLVWIGSILAILLVGIYVLAFTGIGNSIVKPIVEQKVQEAIGIDAKLSTFSLGMSDFSVVLELDNKNTIYANGNYSLFSKKFNVAYRTKLDRLENLQSLVGDAKIKGVFHTEGTVKGDMAFIEIDGVSDVASSDTSYHIELTEFNPTSIIAKIKKADLAELLSLGGQKAYASADVNLDINFKNIKLHQLDGDISLVTSNGKINTKVMKNDFNITLPKTAFAMNLDAKLAGDDVDYNYILKSNLANITSSGKVIPKSLKTNIKYALNIRELAVLKPITGADVRGALKLNGTVKGTKSKMVVDGKTDIASSNTTFGIVLKDFNPASVTAKIKGLKLQKLLYMVKQPHYADALFNLDVDIKDARVGKLNGIVVSNITKGLLDSKFMTKEYEFKHLMPKTTFKAKTITTLSGDIADTKIDFDSSLANLDIKRARFNIADGLLLSDYAVNIAKLEKLYFLTEQHILGGIKANGEVKKGKDLDFTAHTVVAGGNIDVKLHNDDLHVDLKSVKTLELLHKLIYPEIFASSLDAKIDYNLAKQKGKMDGHLSDGKFTQNQAFDLAKQYAKIDMYRDTFKGDIGADINKEKILASLDLVSRTTSIKTKDTKLNTKTNQIDSTIDIDVNHNLLTVELSGKITAPKVKIDADELIKSQAKKAISKKIEKEIGDKLGGEVGNLLKSFF